MFRIKSVDIDGSVWYYAEQFRDGEWCIPENTGNTLSHQDREEVIESKWWGLYKKKTYVYLPPKRLGFKSRSILQILIDHEVTCPMCGIFYHDWYGNQTKVLD